jgi:hypothetical protein
VIEAPRLNKLPAIQVLRGIAASLVVFYHYAGILKLPGPVHSWLIDSGLITLGASGVDIFFVISGFIMVYTTQKKAGARDCLAFIRQRIVRIYPLYWVWSTVMLALWLTGIGRTSRHFSTAFIVNSYLLIPCFNGNDYEPMLARGWTLSFEMLFYIAFACAILLGLRKSKLAFLAGAFVILSVFGRMLPLHSGIGYLTTSPLIIEFLFGVLAAEILLRMPDIRTSGWMRMLPVLFMSLGAVLLLCTVKLGLPGTIRFAVWGLPALLIVFGASMLRTTPCPRLLVYLGDASYSIYLVHGFFGSAYYAAFRHFAVLGRIQSDVTIASASFLTIAISSFTYLLLERHLTKALSPRKIARN